MGIALKSLDAMKLGTVGVNLGNVEAYRVALKGLSVEQSVFALASRGATEEQIRQILVTDQAKLKDVEAAMAKAGLTTATKALNAEEMIELATKKGISIERAKEIANALGLIATEEGQVVSKKQLTVATLQQVGATDAEITAILGLNAAETANIGITNVLTASFAKLWAVITAHPIGAILTAIGVVAVGAVAAYNKWGDTLENTKEKLSDLKSECQEIVSDLQAVNSELETTQQRLEELEGKDTLTFTEKEEYDNLVKINNALQRKIDLLELEEKQKKKEQNKTFVSVMEKDTEDPFEHEVNPDGKKPAGQYSISDEYLTSETGYIEAQFEIRDQLLEDLANAETEKEKERIQKRIDEINKYLNHKKDEWETVSDGIEYIENPKTEDERAVNEWLDYIADFQDRMAIAMSKDDASSNAQYKTNTFNRVVDNWQFDETVQGLQDLGKEGKVTAEMLNDPKYDEFINKLVFLGVIDSADNLEDVALAFNSVADSAENAADSASQYGNEITVLSITDSIKQIADQLEPQFAKLGEAYRDIFTEDGFTLDNIDNSMLEDLRDTFTDIEEELGVTFDTTQLNNFFDVLTNGSSEPEDVQKAFNDLATSYLNSTDVLESLNEETAESVIKQLEQMGVTNAETIVMDRLNAKKEAEDLITNKLNITKDEFIKLSADEQQALLDEADASEICRTYLAQLTLAENNFNKNNLDVTGKIESLKALAVAYGLVNTEAKALEMQERQKKMEEYEKRTGANTGFKYTEVDYKHLEDSARKEIEAKFENLGKVNYDGNKTSYASKDKSSSSKETEKTAETYDWIEKLLERIQSRIDKLDKTASSTYRAWSTRNKALLDELKEVNGEIKAQQKAYDAYMAKANSVGLSEHYKQLVQNGDYSIEDITDDTLKDQISAYEEWYNKAMDCSDAIEDLKDKVSELGMTQFENLVTQYEDQLSSYAHEVEMLQTYIDQTEAKGYDVSADYYKKLISVQESNIEGLKKEYESLKESLHSSVDTGKVIAYSESWYEMVDSIRNVQKSLEDANSSLIEYQNNLRELEWNKFDKFAEKVSQITEESDFLISLMSDEKMFTEEGITDEGQATLGLHAINYNTYLTKADEYAREIQKINGELADDPSNNTLLERRKELLDLQRESILASEDEKQAMLDLVKEGYDVFLESLQKIIDRRKDMMNDIKDLHDFEKEISKQTSEVARLEKILKAYEGDNSEEARAKIQEYKVSLEEAKENLEETEYDKYIQDQEKMLDNLYSQAEEWVNQRLDDLSQLVSDVIDSTNENASNINETIKESADNVGYNISSKLANAFNSAGDGIGNLVSDYNDNFLETMTTLQASVDAIRGLIAGSSDSTASDKIASVEKSEKDIATTKGTWTKNDSGNWNYYKDGNQVKDSWTKYDKDNKWYHLDNEGNMSTNTWIKNKSGTWSYVNDLGQALTGWHKLDWQGSKDWYSFDDEGNMLENQWIDDYFVAKSGKMLTNTWIGHNGKYYWVGEDGKWLDKEGWSLDYKPNDGLPIYEYAKGSKRIPEDQLAWTQEEGTEIIHRASDGALLTPLGQDDMVFTNEASRKLWEFSQDPEGYMSKLGISNLKPVEFAMPSISSMMDIPNIDKVSMVQNVSFDFGDIQMYGVNNTEEFAKQLRNTITTDTKTQKLLTEKIGSSFLGRTDRSNFYR